MVLAVKPEKLDALMAMFAGEDVEAVVVGTFTDDKKLKAALPGYPGRRYRYGLSCTTACPNTPARGCGKHPSSASPSWRPRPTITMNLQGHLLQLQRGQQGMGHPSIRPRGSGRLGDQAP